MIRIIGKNLDAKVGLIMMFYQSLKNSKMTRLVGIPNTIRQMESGQLLCHKILIRLLNAL